jgi:hypothetical protein
MLLTNASFCIVCGTSVRSSSRQARVAMGMGAVPAAVPAVEFADHAAPDDPATPGTDGGAK